MAAILDPPLVDPERSTRTLSLLAAPAAALALGLLLANSDLRGADWPAQLFRIELFRQAGLTVWNGRWYGGHYTWGYSVLFPPLATWFGPMVVGVASTVSASYFLAALLRRHFGRPGAYAACWFAVAATVNLGVGRLPFGLGMALGLAAVYAMQRQRWIIATLCALATTLASPVAGAFLAIAAAAIVIDYHWRRHEQRLPGLRIHPATAVCAVTLAPIVATAILFPGPGTFPFRGGHFFGVMLSSIGLVFFLPRGARILRIAAALVGISAIPIFLIANPLGGNMARISIFFVTPVLAASLWNRRRALVVLAALPLSVWVVMPGAMDDAARALDDPSADESYHLPVVEFIQNAPGPSGRIEIPFTEGHWETAFIAPSLSLARGWERQIDRDRNPLFYEDELDADAYHDWLRHNAVRWVALPDVDLDHSAQAEAELLEAGQPWLRMALHIENWRIWEVIDTLPLVEEPGRLIADTPDGITISVGEPATVLVRSRFTPYWSVDGARACVEPTDDDLTLVTIHERGVVTLQPEFSFDPLLSSGDSADQCDSDVPSATP